MKPGTQMALVGLLVLCVAALMGLISPLHSEAQSPAPLAGLEIALWPEYDRPEVLVILRGTVAADAALPVAVQFNLPASVPSLNAVAYLDESRDVLVDLTEYELTTTATGKVLTLSTPARRFQVEYYIPDLLTRQESGRRIGYAFTATVAIADLRLEVQQPTGARDFLSTPPAATTEVRPDGLTYATYAPGPLAPGEVQHLEVTYQRTDDALSVTGMAPVESTVPAIPAAESPDPAPANATADRFGWVIAALVATAVVVGALGFYAGRRRPARTAVGSSTSRRGGAGAPAAGYCHRCGAPLRPDGAFCHACGTPRRVD